jgi:eukaryotic-like serine/threonine-protein kinase
MSRDEETATVLNGPTKSSAEESEADAPDPTVLRPLARPPALGDLIADKYRLVQTLGRGGMGRIFAADHLLLGTKVALKFMHPHLTRDRTQVARFAREARAAATLKSENTARIIDVDQLPSGELYIVMEYLEGTSLESLAIGGQGLPISDAVRYVVQACDALAEAHARSIIHRDVKPANLFLTTGKSGEPVIKVLDFGLAKSMASTDGFSAASVATVGGQTLGTPHYMAPEQITGASDLDGRVDIWAIGATLYELLTGHLAFAGAYAALVFDQILGGPPTPLRAHRPEIPETLVAIVDRCLMQDPAARYQSVPELVKALEASLTVVATQAIAFVPAPLTPERFVHSSAPPALLGPVMREPPSHVPVLLAPPVAEAAAGGPSMRQTVLAALAGPALLAIVAGVVLLMRATGSAKAGPRTGHTPVASTPIYLTAKSGDPTRSKAPALPEKPEKPRTK